MAHDDGALWILVEDIVTLRCALARIWLCLTGQPCDDGRAL